MKRNIIIAIISFIIIIVLGFVLLGGKSTAEKVTEQLELGNKYLNEGNYKEAIISFNKVIKIEPKNVEARLGLADVYKNSEEYDKAEIVLKEAIAIDNTRSDVYLELIEVYEKADKDIIDIVDLINKGYEKTNDEIFNKKLDEKISELIDIGNKYLSEEKYNKALNIFFSVLNIYSKDIRAMNGLVEIYIAEKSYKKAENILKEVITIDNSKADTYFKLYELYKIMNKDIEEIKVFLEEAYKNTNDNRFKDMLDDLINNSKARGNTLSNIANGGEMVRFKDEIYFSHEQGLYVLNIHDIEPKLIQNTDSGYEYLNYKNGYIYYSNFNGLFRINLKNKVTEQLYEGIASRLNLVNDWLYFTADSPDDYVILNNRFKVYRDRIYKMKIDGSKLEMIGEDSPGKILVHEDWIYYNIFEPTNTENNKYLYRISIDGTNRSLLDEEVYTYVVGNDVIYYTTGYSGYSGYGGQIYKMNTNGSEKQIIFNVENSVLFNIHLSNNLLYYFSDGIKYYDSDYEKHFYQFYDTFCKTQYIFDNYLFYYNYQSEGNSIYKINMDTGESNEMYDIFY